MSHLILRATFRLFAFLNENKKLISRWDTRRKLLENTNYHLNHAIVVKLYHRWPYTQFPRNVRLSHQRIATFSARRDFFCLLCFILLLTYSHLLAYLLSYLHIHTDQFLVDNYLWQFCEITPANHVVEKFYCSTSPSCTVTEILSVEYWREIEIWVRGYSRSLEMAPYDRSRTRSYSYSIVTMAYLVPFLPRDAMHRTDYAVARCPSVCPSHVGILPKWLNISSNFFYHRVATHPSFSTPNGMAIFRRAPPPLTGPI